MSNTLNVTLKNTTCREYVMQKKKKSLIKYTFYNIGTYNRFLHSNDKHVYVL